MKILFPGILAMVMCFGVMAACGGEGDASSAPESSSSIESSTPESSAPLHEHEKDLNDVKDYLQGLIANKTLDTRVNYTVINSYSFFGEEAKYDIAWSTDVEGVTIEEGETEDTVVIAELEEDTPYVLTATISDPEGCHSIEISFDGVALKALTVIPEAITSAPVAGTAYKYHVYQSTLAKDMYFAGEMDGYYFKTTEIGAEGVDVYVEYVAGSTTEFYPYFTDSTGAKQYIGVRLSEDGAHDNIVYASEPVTVFVWNETLGTITTHLDVNKNGEAADYYLGNYSSHKTISASMLSYAGGAGNNVGHLVTLIDKNAVPADEKVAFEKEALNVTAEVTGDKTIELAVKGIRYSEVAIAWAVAGDNATLEGNVLTLTNPAADTTVTLTATLTCGDITDTKAFTITLKHASIPADTVITIPQANELGASKDHNTYTDGKYYVVGKIVEIANTTYGNLYIEDEAGNKLYVYGLYSADGSIRYDAMENAPQVGDTIKVYGILGQYNGNAQMKNAWVVEEGTSEEPEEGLTSIPDANAIASAKDHNTYTEEKYTVKGVVTEIKNTTYGNLYIQDAAGNKFYVYGVYSADGTVRYDAMENAPQVGDTIKITGVLGQYNGTAQMKNGWLVELVKGEAPETPEVPESSEESDSSEVVTPAESPLEEGVAYTVSANNANGTLYLKGTVNGGRWDCSLSAADAVSVYVEDVAGGQLLYMNVDGTKTYFVFADSSTGGSTTTDASAATVFEWNASLQTLEVADDDNARGFGAQPGSTYNNFSCYALSNTDYNWGKFTPVAA